MIIKSCCHWLSPHSPSYIRCEGRYCSRNNLSKKRIPFAPHCDRRAMKPNNIDYMTTSDIASMWAELTQSALYINHQSLLWGCDKHVVTWILWQVFKWTFRFPAWILHFQLSIKWLKSTCARSACDFIRILNFSTTKRKIFTAKNVISFLKQYTFYYYSISKENFQAPGSSPQRKKISFRKTIFRAQIWHLCRCTESGSNPDLDTEFRSEKQKTQEFSKKGM